MELQAVPIVVVPLNCVYVSGSWIRFERAYFLRSHRIRDPVHPDDENQPELFQS